MNPAVKKEVMGDFHMTQTRQDFFGILNMLLSFTAGVFMFKVTASGRLQDMPSD